MSVATSLYVALTNINVPQDQAREVVEALEHTMKNEFATKSDIALVRADIALGLSRLDRHEELTKAEFAAVRSETKAEFAAVRSEMKAEFAAVRSDMSAMETRLLIKLGGLMVTLFGVWSAMAKWAF